jgi:alpha-beta hydrolase superfamily lysophospholipase
MADSILDHPIISQRYFFPRACRIPSPLRIESGDARLACWFHRVDPEALTVVHFHGNGEVVGDYLGDFADRIAGMGCNLLLAEYRGYGMSTGEPQLGRMLEDVGPIVQATGSPPERLVLFGRSAGSLLALEAVSRLPEVAGLVIESGIADPLERLLLRLDPGELGLSADEFAAAVRDRLNHRRSIGAYRGPTLILHALHDDLVDVGNARRLASWAGGPVTLKLFDRGDHNTVLTENEAGYFAAVAEFLGRVGPKHHSREA